MRRWTTVGFPPAELEDEPAALAPGDTSAVSARARSAHTCGTSSSCSCSHAES